MIFNVLTYKEIQKKTCHQKNYVRKWIERFNKHGSCDNLKSKNQPRKIFSSLKTKISNKVKSNNRLSCRSIAKKLNAKSKIISKSSVHRIMKSKGMRYVYTKKKSFLQKKILKKDFYLLKNIKINQWLFGKGLFGMMNVHLKLEELVENCGSKKAIQNQLNLQKQYPLKVLIWGAIGWNQKRDLYFTEPGKRLNSQYYQQIVEGSLVTKAQSLSLKLVIVMQNGAPCHSSESTINFLNEKYIQVLSQCHDNLQT